MDTEKTTRPLFERYGLRTADWLHGETYLVPGTVQVDRDLDTRRATGISFCTSDPKAHAAADTRRRRDRRTVLVLTSLTLLGMLVLWLGEPPRQTWFVLYAMGTVTMFVAIDAFRRHVGTPEQPATHAYADQHEKIVMVRADEMFGDGWMYFLEALAEHPELKPVDLVRDCRRIDRLGNDWLFDPAHHDVMAKTDEIIACWRPVRLAAEKRLDEAIRRFVDEA